ncbi:MAG: hypothetical protein CSA68_02860 [Rhodobacterales bacterium]|nr:MAG: hypothetical protein CSA68_02860 [Rhodobacterales bacterium]
MTRLITLVFSALFILSACEPQSPTLDPDGQLLQRVYRIKSADTGKIQLRMRDSINALRSAGGVAPLSLDAKLTAAAATHSRDMSVQNRAWHFGSDGSSPLDRVARTKYAGKMLGENISETYEAELETLAAWMDKAGTRAVIMDPKAVNMGFSWHQDKNGKIWWTLVTGS